MSEDYTKRAARHKQQISKKNSAAVPKKLMAITFILLSCFLAFLYYLTQIGSDSLRSAKKRSAVPVQKEVKASTSNKQTAPPIETSKADDEYDFYKLLPQTEVIPPKVEEYQSKTIQQAQAKVYLLQAGSFRHREEADRLRAKLILEGLDVSIQQVKASTGTNWHRVLVGPFTSRSKLNHAQDILARANTESMLIELKQ